MAVDYVIGAMVKSTKNIVRYREKKINIMNTHFCVSLTESEINNINGLNTINEIDAYCFSILNNRWG